MEFVALGAARQAAWALSNAVEPPVWRTQELESFNGKMSDDAVARYEASRDATDGFELHFQE